MEIKEDCFPKKFAIVRGSISLLLLLVFIVVFFTGLGLAFAPAGKIAKETGWTFLGFPKFKLERLHNVSGFLMSGLVVIHLLLNYKLLMAELKMMFKK